MTKDQRAMVMAMLYPHGQERGRGEKGLENKHLSKVSVAQARTVLQWLPGRRYRHSELVLTGSAGRKGDILKTSLVYHEAIKKKLSSANGIPRTEQNKGRPRQAAHPN